MTETAFSSRRRWPAFLAAAGLIVLLDQAVKYAVMATMPYGAGIPITPFFNLASLRPDGSKAGQPGTPAKRAGIR